MLLNLEKFITTTPHDNIKHVTEVLENLNIESLKWNNTHTSIPTTIKSKLLTIFEKLLLSKDDAAVHFVLMLMYQIELRFSDTPDNLVDAVLIGRNNKNRKIKIGAKVEEFERLVL